MWLYTKEGSCGALLAPPALSQAPQNGRAGAGEPCTQLELREIQMAAVLEGGNCNGVGVVKHFASDSPFSALSDIGL